MKSLAIPLFVALSMSVPSMSAEAAGPYDGTWVIDAPQAGGTGAAEDSAATGCEPLRLEFRIVDNRIVGTLHRSLYGGTRVETGPGPGSAPVTGTVSDDGTLNAQWGRYKATGKLAGNNAEVRWRGECGERMAMGSRIGSAGESAGSSGTR